MIVDWRLGSSGTRVSVAVARGESVIDFSIPQKLPRMMFAWPET